MKFFCNKVNEFLRNYNRHLFNVVLGVDFNFTLVNWEGAPIRHLIYFLSASEPIADLALYHNLTKLVKQNLCIMHNTSATLSVTHWD